MGGVDDLGDPSSYLSLERGTPVFSNDGREVGCVEHVIADETDDIFEGIVLDTSRLPGGHRFVDEEQVARIYDLGGRMNVPVAIGGVVVTPGDAVLCDESGVLVLPPDEAEAEARRRTSGVGGQVPGVWR